MGGATLFEKVWAEHEVADLGDGLSLLHVDRHLMHDLNGMKSLVELRERGLGVRNPELTTATPDHGISTIPGRTDDSNPATAALLQGLREETARAGILRLRRRAGRPGHRARDRAPSSASPSPAASSCAATATPAPMAASARSHSGVGAQRGRARAGDADHLSKPAEADARALRRDAAPARLAERPHPLSHRQGRRRRRHRLRGRVRRQCHQGDVGRGAAHHLQSLDRARRQIRHDRAGRHDVRISSPVAPTRPSAPLGQGGRILAHAVLRRRRDLPQGGDGRCRCRRAADHLGHQPAACHRGRRPRPRSRRAPPMRRARG